MKFLLLLSVTVAFVATGTQGLQCYMCTGNSNCQLKVTCPPPYQGKTFADACLTERKGLEKYALPMLLVTDGTSHEKFPRFFKRNHVIKRETS